ncbi:hypothetical protein IVA87_08750 [Bradyrhizobium sp. 147]|uniref:bifunctional DNA primase/polymerase n=1 Tax=Bradyrhizobium sp. 147 TaxID=2782623 RepID=UPI001FF9AEB1|nr:bifunctional DNA primase/polymerase [Bradyrhizobium sp. 147]MCK1679548.1 hypothetical protein [Bradyrhizobium sp. 147]
MNIATFPFDATQETKRGPLVSHYKRMGLQASRQIALRFPDAPGVAAMAGARNRLAIVDIDERGPAGERLLDDTQRQFGTAKFVVRTGSGGFHAYYSHNGEGRKIRPDPRRPVDIIGDGPIVLPPSRGFRGTYEIIHGRLDDLAALQPMRPAQPTTTAGPGFDPRSLRVGERDEKFWRYIKRYAHQATSHEALLGHAREINEMMPVPLTDAEVVAKCKHWWRKTERGENRWGFGQFTTVDHGLIDSLMMSDPDGFALLMFLRRHHWGRPFYLANEMHASMPGGGWRRQRFTSARARLIKSGIIQVLEPASFKPNRPMLCSLEQPGRGVSRNGQQ